MNTLINSYKIKYHPAGALLKKIQSAFEKGSIAMREGLILEKLCYSKISEMEGYIKGWSDLLKLMKEKNYVQSEKLGLVTAITKNRISKMKQQMDYLENVYEEYIEAFGISPIIRFNKRQYHS